MKWAEITGAALGGTAWVLGGAVGWLLLTAELPGRVWDRWRKRKEQANATEQ